MWAIPNHLLNTDWSKGVPSLNEKSESGTDLDQPLNERDLENLQKIAVFVQRTLNDPSHNREDIENLAHKCWDYATKLSKGNTSLQAYLICRNILPQNIADQKEKENFNDVVLTCGDETLKLPLFYKKFLSQHSSFFQTLFGEGKEAGKGFKEHTSSNISLEDVNKDYLERMIKLTFESQPLLPPDEDLLEFARQASYLDMADSLKLASDRLLEIIKNLDPSDEEDRETAASIYKNLSFLDTPPQP